MNFSSKISKLSEVFRFTEPYFKYSSGDPFTNPRLNIDLISMLPYPIIQKIAASLAVRDVLRMLSVSKRWNLLSRTSSVWQALVERDFKLEYLVISTYDERLSKLGWMNVYRNLYKEKLEHATVRAIPPSYNIDANNPHHGHFGNVRTYGDPSQEHPPESDGLAKAVNADGGGVRSELAKQPNVPLGLPYSKFNGMPQNLMPNQLGMVYRGPYPPRPLYGPGKAPQQPYQVNKLPYPAVMIGSDFNKPSHKSSGGRIIPLTDPTAMKSDFLGDSSNSNRFVTNPHGTAIGNPMNDKLYTGRATPPHMRMQSMPQGIQYGRVTHPGIIPNGYIGTPYGHPGGSRPMATPPKGQGFYQADQNTEASDTETEDILSQTSQGSRRRREALPTEAKVEFKRWLFQNSDHPYPMDELKRRYAKKFDLSVNQVNNWFSNARRRLLSGERREPGRAPRKRKLPFSTLLEVAETEREKEVMVKSKRKR